MSAKVIRFPSELCSQEFARMEGEAEILILPIVRIDRDEAEAPPSDGHMPGRRRRRRKKGEAA